MDSDGRESLDRDLEAEPKTKTEQPFPSEVMAVMMAARMPQQASPFSAPGSEWSAGG